MVNPVPGYEGPSVDGKGRSSEAEYRFKKSLSRLAKSLSDLGLPESLTIDIVNADELYDDGNRVLTEAGGQTIDAGFDSEPKDHGTVSSGTITIDPLDGQHHKITGNGAFTLQPGSTTKHTTAIVHLTNGASAGSVTFSGLTKKYPSGSLDTTNGHKFAIIFFFYGSDGVDYSIQPRQ